MTDQIKMQMDAAQPIAQAKDLAAALEALAGSLRSVASAGTKFDETGNKIGLAVKGIDQAGRQVSITLAQTEKGWTEISRTLGTAVQKIEASSPKVGQAMAKVQKTFDGSVQAINKSIKSIDVASIDHKLAELLYKNKDKHAEFQTIADNLAAGRNIGSKSLSAPGLKYAQLLAQRNKVLSPGKTSEQEDFARVESAKRKALASKEVLDKKEEELNLKAEIKIAEREERERKRQEKEAERERKRNARKAGFDATNEKERMEAERRIALAHSLFSEQPDTRTVWDKFWRKPNPNVWTERDDMEFRRAQAKAKFDRLSSGMDDSGIRKALDTGVNPHTLSASEMQLRAARGQLLSYDQALRSLGKNDGLQSHLKGLKEVALSWQSFGRYMATHAAFTAMYGAGASIMSGVSQSMDLSKAVSTVRTLDKSNGSQADWTKSALKVSNAYGTGATDVAKSYYSALSNQMGDDIQSIEQFTIATQKLAVATNSTAEEANNLIASFVNAYGTGTYEINALSAQIFKTIDLGRIKASDMANSIGRVLVPASQLGVKAGEVMAVLARLTQMGVTPHNAVTQMLNIMNGMIKPSTALEKIFTGWGYSTAQAAVQGLGFMKVMERLNSEFKGNQSSIAESFNDIRSFQGVVGVTKDLEAFKKVEKEISESSSEFNRAVKEQMENPANSLARQVNRTKNEFLSWGTSALPYIDSMAKSVGGLDNAVRLLTPAFVGLGLAVTGAVGSSAFQSLFGLITKHPALLAVAAAIAAIGTAFTIANSNSDNLFDKMREASSLATSKLDEDLQKQLRLMEEHSQKLTETVSTRTAAQTKEAQKFYESLDEFEKNYREAIKVTGNTIKDGFDSRIKSINEAISKLKSDISSLESSSGRLVSTPDDKTLGMKTIDKYRTLFAENKDLASQISGASPDKVEEITKRMKANAAEMRAIEAKAAKPKKEQAADALKAEENELRARLDTINHLQEVQKFNYENQYRKQKEYNEKAKEHNKGLKEGDSRRWKEYHIPGMPEKVSGEEELNIKQRLNEIDAIQRTQALTEANDKRTALSSEQSSYGEILALAKERQKVEEDTVKAIQAQAEAAKKQLEAKQAEEKAVKENKQRYEDQLDAYEKQLKAGQKLTDPRQVEEAAKSLDELRSLILESANKAGVNVSIQDRNTLSAGGEGLRLQVREAEAKRVQEEAELQRQRDYDKHKEEVKLAQANRDFLSKKEQEALAKANAIRADYGWSPLNPNVDDTALQAMSDKHRKFGADNAKTMFIGNLAGAAQALGDQENNFRLAREARRNADEELKRVTAKPAVSEKTDQAFTELQRVGRVSNTELEKIRIKLEAGLTIIERKAMGGYHALGGALGSDTVPAWLAPGEFVVNSGAARRFHSELMAMNSGTRMASGGAVSSVNVGDINITLQSSSNTSMDVAAIGQALKREIKRGTLCLS